MVIPSRPRACPAPRSSVIGPWSRRPGGRSARPRGTIEARRAMRILVVEDDRKVASFIRQGLEEEGHTVEAAADGDAALDLLLGADPYDLIVLDVMLPKRDGFAVLKAARQSGVLSPVIMLTARDSVADKVTGLALGADDYLAKPFALDELLARVRALFRRRSGRRAPLPRPADPPPDPATRHAAPGW